MGRGEVLTLSTLALLVMRSDVGVSEGEGGDRFDYIFFAFIYLFLALILL